MSAPPSVSSLAKDNGGTFPMEVELRARFRFLEKVIGELLLRRRPLYPTELRRQIRKRCAVREKTLHSTRPFLFLVHEICTERWIPFNANIACNASVCVIHSIFTNFPFKNV